MFLLHGMEWARDEWIPPQKKQANWPFTEKWLGEHQALGIAAQECLPWEPSGPLASPSFTSPLSSGPWEPQDLLELWVKVWGTQVGGLGRARCYPQEKAGVRQHNQAQTAVLEALRGRKKDREGEATPGRGLCPDQVQAWLCCLLACTLEGRSCSTSQVQEEVRSCPVGGLGSPGPQISPQAWGGVCGTVLTPGPCPTPVPTPSPHSCPLV